jgi:hypothetical protein
MSHKELETLGFKFEIPPNLNMFLILLFKLLPKKGKQMGKEKPQQGCTKKDIND